MTRRGMAGSMNPALAGKRVGKILMMLLAGLVVATAAAAADYELRLVPYDDPDSVVSAGGVPGGYWQFFFSLSESVRNSFSPPYSCWISDMKLDGGPLFKLYDGGKFIGRKPRARPKLKPGKHTLWPGDHVFTVEADGSIKTDDPELIVSTETLEGRKFNVLRIKCYPVSLRSENADTRAKKPGNMLEEIRLPSLTLRESKDSEEATVRDRAVNEELRKTGAPPVSTARELLPSIRRFLTLTAWLPANTAGKGYVVHPLKQTFHVGAKGIVPGAGGGHSVSSWRVKGYEMMIPITRVPVEGSENRQIMIEGIQNVSFGKGQFLSYADLYSRREPYKFRVSQAGPAILIDGDLTKLPNKVFRVEINPANPRHQRGLVVETETRHLDLNHAFMARVRALDPAEGSTAAMAAARAFARFESAVEAVPKAQEALEKAKAALTRDQNVLAAATKAGDKAKIDAATAKVKVAEKNVTTAQQNLAKAEKEKQDAQKASGQRDEKAEGLAGKNPFGTAQRFARLRARESDQWVDLAVKDAPEGMIEVSIPSMADGVYQLRLGVRLVGAGQKNFYADQWVTFAKGDANGVGVFTQRGRTAFYRGESFWLALGVLATAAPVPADTPVTVDLVDADDTRIKLYRGKTAAKITESETFIINVEPPTSRALAPGQYRVDAQVGGRGGPPFHIEIVDPAPETHFTKLLLGKYNNFFRLYSACLANNVWEPDDVVRAIAESGYNVFKGMTYSRDRVAWPDRGLAELAIERPRLGPWEAYAPPSGRDQFLNAMVRHNLKFYENLFTQHDTMMPRGEKILDACERYATMEAQAMRHSPAFRGVCLYDEFSQSLDHSTGAEMIAYFRRADEQNYRDKYPGMTSSKALRDRDRFFSRPEGQRDYKFIKSYRTWPQHLDDQWKEFSARIAGAVKAVMPEAVNFTLARLSALPGSTLGGGGDGSREGVSEPLEAATTVGYKDMGGWGAFALAGPLAADALRTRDGLLVWPTLYGNGTGRWGASNVRQAFFTLSQKCEGLAFMQFASIPTENYSTTNYWTHSHYDTLKDILGVLCTRYGDLFLGAQRGYKKVAIYYSTEMGYISGGSLGCEGLWVACMRAGYPADFLFDKQIRADKGMEYDLIFVPGIYHTEAIPPETLAALKRLKAARKILAVEAYSRLGQVIEGVERLSCGLGEISAGMGGTFPKHLDHDDERWWDMTIETTKAVKEFLSKHVEPAAEHDLLVGPDWLRLREGQYMVIPNQAVTDFTGNHKTIYQAPDMPTLRIPMGRFPKGLPACYDMLEMERIDISASDDGATIPLQVDFRYYPGKIYAFLPAAIDAVSISVPSSAKAGQDLSYELFATDANNKMIDAGIPLEITITAPSGKVLQKVYRAAGPTYKGAYCVPVNIGNGGLKLQARELISGRSVETTVQLTEGEIPPATLDDRLVRIFQPEKVREFMKTGTNAADPLFKKEDLRRAGQLALRICDGEDALAKHLKSKFSPAALKLLDAHEIGDEASPDLQAALVDVLNKTITDGRLYTDELFPPGILTMYEGAAGQEFKEGPSMPDINRMLLEGYYKSEITKRPSLFIAVEEEWARPQADRIGKAFKALGRRVRVGSMDPWRRGAGAITTGDTAGDLTLDGTRMWRGTVVQPGVFLDGPVIVLGSRRKLANILVERDLLAEPISDNFPGRGKAIVAWVHQAFSNYHDTVAVLATDKEGLKRGVDVIMAPDGQKLVGLPIHSVVQEPEFDEKAQLRAVSGKEREQLSYHDAVSMGDRVVTMNVDPATGRIIVGTFGFGHNIFCFSAEGELLWKNFLPEHDVYMARWYDGGKKVLASTAQGFYVFLINGEDGKVFRKFASTEWPNFHVNEREFNTQISAKFNPKIRQILINGQTGLVAVDYDGNQMWFYDRAREIVEYPSKAVQSAYASFGGYLSIAGVAPSPDGKRLAYNEYRFFASTMGFGGPMALWKNEPQILDAMTGKVLLKNFTDPGSNDRWGVSWPADSPDPWIHARNLRAPLRFTGKGDPDPGKLGTYVPPPDPQLKTGGGKLFRDYRAVTRTDPKGRVLWTISDENFWVEGFDKRNEDDTRLYRCSRDGLLRCIDLQKGETIWEHQLQFVARLLLTADNSIVAGARNGDLVRLDADGKVLWEKRLRDLHDVPKTDYPGYVAKAKLRERDDTEVFYPVFNDTPGDFKGLLRMGIGQIDNGGFEIPEGWSSPSGNVELDKLAKDGQNSLWLRDAQLVTYRVKRKVIPSATYLLEFYYRTEDRETTLAAGARLGGEETALTLSNFHGRPNEWVFGRVAIKSMSDTKTIDVGFEADGGRVRVDTVSLRPVRFPSANLLANPELHKVQPTHPKDFRHQYPRIPPRLSQKLLHVNNVTSFLQATPLGALIFTQEQAYLHNGRLDDIGMMWCYRPDAIGFGVMLVEPAYVSHLVLYMNNSTPETVYRNIAILANRMTGLKAPYTVGFVRGNRRRFVVVHFPEPLWTDNLKVLPGKYRTQRDTITEIEVYGPVGGRRKQRDFFADKFATHMFMGTAAHVPRSLPDDFVGQYKLGQTLASHYGVAIHPGTTAVDETLTLAMATGGFKAVPITKEKKDALTKAKRLSREWKTSTVTPLTTPARYAGRLIAGSADYKMHAVVDNGTHIWAFETGGRIYSSPTPDKDEVYFGSDDAHLYKIDVDSGVLLWEFKTGGRIRSSPALDGKQVYVASWDGFLYAVNMINGTQAWKAPIAPYTRSSAVVQGGRVYIADEGGKLHCFDAGTGKSNWSAEIGGLISMCPVVTREGIFVSSEEGTVALVARDGTVKWKTDVLKGLSNKGVPSRLAGQPFATKTQIVLTSTQGLFVLKRQDGTPDTRLSLPAGIAGKNLVSAVPYGSRLCLIGNRVHIEGGWTRFIVKHGAEAVVLEPVAAK